MSGIAAALLLSGLLGSFGHCAGMCGPLVLMAGLQSGRGTAQHLALHAARITVYAALGALAGGLGSLLGIGTRLNQTAALVSIALGLLVLGGAVRTLGWLPLRTRDPLGALVGAAISRVLARPGPAGMLALGVLNGLLPCGLVYSALLVAAGAGSAAGGALAMAAFGAGTAPALLAIGLGANRLGVRARERLARAAGVLMLLVGAQLALRGAAALGIVPSLQIGGLVLW